jgi:predicted nucleic acid-binding protein
MKTLIIAFPLAMAACSVVPSTPPSSPDYPTIALERKSYIEDMAWQLDLREKNPLVSWKVAVSKAENHQILDNVQAGQVKQLLIADAKNAQVQRRHEEEEREIEAKRKADYFAMLEKNKAEQAARTAEAEQISFRQSFESIRDPVDAKNFRFIYANHADPDGFLVKAEQRGFEQGVKTATRCIDRANALIAQQKKIAAEVGYVDKNVMYQAGAALVKCKQNLADWSKMIKR